MGEITEYNNYLKGRNGDKDWQECLHYYFKAYFLRPHRAEPLIKIAHHYFNTGDMALSYFFAHKAVQMPYPSSEVLFIEQGMYDFDRYKIFGQSAWYVGDFKGGEDAVRKALARQPKNTQLQHDLSCYEHRKAQKSNKEIF